MTEKFIPETGPNPEKEPFRGEIRIEPELIDQDKWTDDKKLIVIKLVIDDEGKVKIRKETYDMTKVPKDVDDAEFDAAESYDKSPKIETIDIDPSKADEVLAKMQQDLEKQVKEAEAELEIEEDEEQHHLMEDNLYMYTKPDLEKVIKARKDLKK